MCKDHRPPELCWTSKHNWDVVFNRVTLTVYVCSMCVPMYKFHTSP